MKKRISILLVLVLALSLFAPLAAADNTGTPGREDMRGHGDIAVPRRDAWLDHYETRYVCASGGVAAFLFSEPKVDMEKKIDTVLEGTELTVLAEQDEFYLVKMADRRLGWICVGQTAEDTKLLDSVPDLKEGSWIYSRGEGERNTFAVKLGDNRSATMLRVSDGGKIRTGWILSGRRLRLDEKYFVWNGDEFVSRDEYQTAQGKLRFTVSVDAEGLYDSLAK